jgi:hypothetical protein
LKTGLIVAPGGNSHDTPGVMPGLDPGIHDEPPRVMSLAPIVSMCWTCGHATAPLSTLCNHDH